MKKPDTPTPAASRAATWSNDEQSALNDWFLSLPEGRRKALLEGDRWMLAGAAFVGGRAAQPASPAPLTEAQRKDLLMAARYFAGDEGDVGIKSSDQVRIVRTLFEVGSLDELVGEECEAAALASQELPDVPNTFKELGESDDAWIDRITGAAQPASPAPLTDIVTEAWAAIGEARQWLNTDRPEARRNALVALNKVRDDFGRLAALASPQVAPAPEFVAREGGEHSPAPSNNLPGYAECAVRVANSDFLSRRKAEGGYGPEPDSKLATELHRFIYEYDDADPYKSAWFMHRLERVIKEAAAPVQVAPRPEASVLNDQIREVVEYHEGQHRFSPLKHSPDPVTRAGWKKQMDAIESVLDALPDAEGEATGWPPGMLQDDDRKLSRALAGTPHARAHADEAAAAIKEMERIRFAAPASPTPAQEGKP